MTPLQTTEDAFAAGVRDAQAEPPLTRADAAAAVRRAGRPVIERLRVTLQAHADQTLGAA